MSIKSIFLVFLQIVTMAYLLIVTNRIGNGFGLVLQTLGFIIAVWGMLTMKFGNFNVQPEVKSSTLITIGPYKLIRNPMYTGVILIFLPMIINNFSYLNLVVYSVLVLTLLLKIFSEEQFLEKRFGEDYTQYKTGTYRLFPYLF